MKSLRDESGQMLIMMALTLSALLGFLALATDVGTLFNNKRQLQIAADAGATAGAIDLNYGQSSAQAITDATNAALANGVKQASYVTVSTPPVDGYHMAPGYVEVSITQPSPTFFMSLFGFKSMNISARAVAGSPGAATDCAYLMYPDGYDFKVQGDATVNSPGCGWYVNSDNPGAITAIGGALTVNSPGISVLGSGPADVGGSPVYTYSARQSPPNIQSVGAVPSPTGCPVTETGTSFSGQTIDGNNGVVCFTNPNGADISGANLNNGVFVFEYGVTMDTGSTTNVTNGTIEVYSGTYTQQSNAVLTVHAPQATKADPDAATFGGLSYNGVALLVPATNPYYSDAPCASSQPGNAAANGALQVQFGSNNSTFDGYIVAPNAQVYLQDNGGGTVAYGLYAGCMFDKSSLLNVTSYNVTFSQTTPLRVVSLVE